MSRQASARPRAAGFTLTEIMVAIVISLILMAGVINIFISSKRGYRLDNSIARVQENARYALDAIAQDVRMAGYTGCKGGSVANTLQPTASNWPYNFSTPLQGFDNSDTSTWPTEYVASTSPGTDSVVVLRGDTTDYKIEQNRSNSAEFKLDTLSGLDVGTIVMASDCVHTSIFQITNTQSATRTVVHQTGSGAPGNCTKGLGSPVNCSDVNGITYNYGNNARLMQYVAHAYYIGTSTSGVSRALKRVQLKANGTLGNSEELVDGVENMQILYGEDTDGDNLAERYVTADNADMDDVVSVRIGLLMHTIDEPATKEDTRKYVVAGTDIDDAGTTVLHAKDKRMRFVMETTVKLRNKGTK